jgi:diadenosine tetraphosphate (Ap4A) HIT family hydrolase
MNKRTCFFCEIAAGRAPALVVYENDAVVCLLPTELVVYGHALIIPIEVLDSE